MKVYFEIQSDEPSKAVEFYKQIFDWEFTKQEGLPIEYWRINVSDGAILKRPAKTPPMEYGTNAYVCSFKVTDFDATAQKILDLGGIVALPKFAVPGVCWQGYFLDKDHNTFGIFQPDPNAK